MDQKENICSVVSIRSGKTTVLSGLVVGGSLQTTETMSVMKPLHYLCTVFGLASFHIYKKYEKKGTIFLQPGVWWSCLWVVIYTVNLCLEIFDTVRRKEIPVKITIVCLLYYLSLHFTNIISLCVCSIFRRRHISQIVHKIDELRNAFIIKMDRNILCKRVRNFVMFETIFLLLYIVTNIIYVYVNVMNDPSVLKCFMFLLESLGCTFNSLLIIQFVNVITISRHICKCINHELEICCDMIEDSFRCSIIRSHIRGVSIFRSLDVKVKPFGRLRNYIHGLRIVYSRLNSVTRLINAYFALPILLGISWLFMSVVSVLYATLYFFVYISYTDNSFIRYGSISVDVSFCIYCGILMAMLTTTCHIVGSETEKTIFLVQKILLYPDLGKQTENEFKKFCSQLIHLKLEISACGLFELNLSFFNNFTNKFFAYFIIMFQLK